ncbi:hypothetical protein CKAH01_18862 [Colletotrichum kahawae]|uniref:Nephrocystin 3-like N-terminal domain-containing protein n=1 Tax=Colletotrichum kahawae TaxID=34407 RepID=A0AAE0D0T0_COLKA|nr:hypothetical protein CKAH01_18862 [Colletotrichum kahawae]
MPSSKAIDGSIPVQQIYVNAGPGGQFNNSGTGYEEHDRFLRDLSTTDPSADKKRIERKEGGLISDLNGWILNHKKSRSHITPFYEKYEKRGKALFEDANSWDVLAEMVQSMTSSESTSKAVLVIDALDECSDRLDQLLAVLVKLSSGCKIVVSSRRHPSIDNGLSVLGNKISLSLEDNGTAVSGAVGKYIRHKVSELKRLKKYNEATQKEVSAYLKSNAEGTFLWVSLVYQQLAKITLSNKRTMETLRAFPPGLDSLYGRILAQIMKSPDKKLCRKILATVCILHHPFDLSALAMLLDKEEESLKDAVEECFGLLVLKNNVVYFVHQSAKAFLQKEAERDIMPSGYQHENKMVLSRLVETMSSTLRRNIYGLDDLGASIPKDHNIASDPLAPARYSCLHWTEHFSKANAMDKKQQLLIHQFLSEHCLHWVEAICHLRSVSKGIEGLTKVFNIFQSLEVGGTKVSPVAFSPDGKTLASAYEDKHVRIWKPTTGSYARTLRGHSGPVHCVAFSQDGTTIISGSADGTIILWDPKDGKCKGTRSAQGTDIVFVCLVTSGTQLIAGCRGGSVRFWDLEDKAYYRKIPKVDSYILALSNDGKVLASPTATGEVRLCDTKTRKRQKSLEGHTDKIQALAFSDDGYKLASASEDETIKIWNPTTGECLITLKCKKVSSIVFSADGTQQLVSNSAAGRSIFWDARTGRKVRTIRRCYSGAFKSISLKADGKMLASAADDKTVKLWDLKADDPSQPPQPADDPTPPVIQSHETDEVFRKRIWHETLSGLHLREKRTSEYSR